METIKNCIGIVHKSYENKMEMFADVTFKAGKHGGIHCVTTYDGECDTPVLRDILVPQFDLEELCRAVQKGVSHREFNFKSMAEDTEVRGLLRGGHMHFPWYGMSIDFGVSDRSKVGFESIYYDEKHDMYIFKSKKSDKRVGPRNLERMSYARIIAVLKTGPKTSQEIAGILGIGINSVSGRLSEMYQEDAVVKIGTKKYPNRKENTLWKLVE